MIVPTFRAEWFKAVRRPAVWVVIALLLILAVGLGYVVLYLVATHPPPGATRLQAANLTALRTSLYPDVLVRKTLGQTSNLDGVFALILGVLLQGSEYGWQTVKTAYIQRPGRLALLGGKIGALALLVLVMAAGIFAVDAAATYAVTSIDGKSIAFPALDEILKGVGAAWLILGFWAAFGMALATLFRQSAMAIGLGLAYGLVIETLLFGVLGGLGDVVKHYHVWFPIANAGYLVRAFGTIPGAGDAGLAAPDADATHAVLVLLAYVVGLLALSGVLVHRRDVL